MSREIKFRAFHKEKKIIAEVGTWFWNGHARVSWTDPDLYEKEKDSNMFYPGSVGGDWNKDEFVLMQFTGLRDNWEKEIWEGDRVKIVYTDWPSKNNDDPRTLDQYLDDIALTGEVVLFEDRWCIKYDSGNYGSIMPGTHGFIKVIGNIYEKETVAQ